MEAAVANSEQVTFCRYFPPALVLRGSCRGRTWHLCRASIIAGPAVRVRESWLHNRTTSLHQFDGGGLVPGLSEVRHVAVC